MSKSEASFPIESHQYISSGVRYDLTIYQRGSRFFAAWYCRECLTRIEIADCADGVAAKSAAEASIDVHNLTTHAGRDFAG